MDVCPKCQKALNCSSKDIYCDICNNWLHLKCSNVSNIQFAELASSSAPYYCHACKSNALPINAVINTNDVKTDYLGLAETKDEDIEVGCDQQQQQQFYFFYLNASTLNNTDTVRPGGGEKTLRSSRLPPPNHHDINSS